MQSEVLIFVDQPEYEHQLRTWLEGLYHVRLPAGIETLDEAFDLCIVDRPALERLQESLLTRRQAEQPVFLPVLLLMERQSMSVLPAHIWQYVDDVITCPMQQMELQTRLEMLLRARQFSITKSGQPENEQRVLAEALRDTATTLTSTLELSQVFERILTNVGRVVPHDAAHIEVIADGIARVVRSQGYTDYGLDQKIRRQQSVIAETPHLDQMVKSRQPVVIPDVTDYAHRDSLQLNEKFPCSYVGAPIHLNDEIIGFIHLGSSTPHFFTPIHADRLRAFAEQAAIAIQNARLFEQKQVLAAVEERQRIARDLHDAVSQTLFSANVIAEALPRLWERDPERAREKLDDLQRLTRGALAETRAVLWELQPTALEILDLGGLLHEMAAALRNRKRLTVLLNLDQEPQLSNEVKFTLYRIAHEALDNIIKHARATEVRMELRNQAEIITLIISDNGRGFDPQGKKRGQGLPTMHERAAEINATLQVVSSVGNGTQVIVSWANKVRKK